MRLRILARAMGLAHITFDATPLLNSRLSLVTNMAPDALLWLATPFEISKVSPSVTAFLGTTQHNFALPRTQRRVANTICDSDLNTFATFAGQCLRGLAVAKKQQSASHSLTCDTSK